MILKTEIDYWIDVLLDFLLEIQNQDGSFNTMYLQPHYNPDKGWMNYAGNSPYETSNTLIPLSFLSSLKAKKITNRGIQFLIENSLDQKLWTYAYPSKNDLVPYDTDSTSLSSYILAKNGYEVKNKDFLNTLINKHNHYPFYIWVNRFSEHLPFSTSFKMLLRNWKTKNSTNILNEILRLNDWEFSSTCINLLYIGKMPENQRVWTEIQNMFKYNSINYLYYIDLFHSFYFYTRLAGYENFDELINDSSLLEKYISELYSVLNANNGFSNRLLLANSILFCNRNISNHQELFYSCLNDLKNESFKLIFPMYSSNVETDFQPINKKPNTFFGSNAHTCSLYIEFLNLYRKNIYGSFYENN